MNSNFHQAYVRGVERLTAWADVLNSINVFPVADSDTGTNLIISLSPLLQWSSNHNREDIIRKLMFSARGNSGNIAACFFSGFLTADSFEHLYDAAKIGKDRAWNAIADPKPGTMLTVFDALVEALSTENILKSAGSSEKDNLFNSIIDHLERAVFSTRDILPTLKKASVVDSGALGMFIYLQTFFLNLSDKNIPSKPITETFKGVLSVSPDFMEHQQKLHCINATVQLPDDNEHLTQTLSAYGQHAVVRKNEDYLSFHLHTHNIESLRKKIESTGTVIKWVESPIEQSLTKNKAVRNPSNIHIMTDAAGSVTDVDAERFGMTILNSYITIGDQSLPESYVLSDHLYQSMKKGVNVSTSQASVFERHQYYQRVVDQYDHVIYLCVGSVYTGNYHVAEEWKKQYDTKNRFVVIDTQAASGRLGMIALATAQFASNTENVEAVCRFAKKIIPRSHEYIFLDKLKYLAAGGRLSKTSAFVGDVLKMKPIISPEPDGAKKVGVVRNQNDQVRFAIDKLRCYCENNLKSFIMLEYSDNRSWVEQIVVPKIRALLPKIEILLQPLSKTSGAHMGPGTWGIAFISETGDEYVS